MRTVTVASLLCLAGALSGCNAGGMFSSRVAGNSVEFVASNTDSVLLDFAANPPGELASASQTATQQCQIFGRSTAVLESLNLRGEGTIRATFLCRNPTMTASIAAPLQHRE
jgi:hypothetical protein